MSCSMMPPQPASWFARLANTRTADKLCADSTCDGVVVTVCTLQVGGKYSLPPHARGLPPSASQLFTDWQAAVSGAAEQASWSALWQLDISLDFQAIHTLSAAFSAPANGGRLSQCHIC